MKSVNLVSLIVIVSALLLLALLPMPYGFYTLLRIVSFLIFVFIAYSFFKQGKEMLTWYFLGLAILFNPLIIVHFPKDVWMVIDLVVLVSFFFIRKEFRINC